MMHPGDHLCYVYRFFLKFTRFFCREALNPIFVDHDAGISYFLSHISIVIFDDEQV